MQFSQLLTNLGFYLSIAGIVVVGYISTRGYYREARSVTYIIDMLIGLSFFKKMTVIFAAIPFASSFCNDWNFQYIKPTIIRGGINRYIFSKVVVCSISAFLTVSIGLLLYAFILSFKYPLHHMNDQVMPPYGSLLASGFPFSFTLLKIFIFSLAATMWTISGLTISAILPNRFVAIASPFVFGYIIQELTMSLPLYLNIYVLTRGGDVIQKGVLLSFLYTVFVFLLLILFLGLLFKKLVEMRLGNELV